MTLLNQQQLGNAARKTASVSEDNSSAYKLVDIEGQQRCPSIGQMERLAQPLSWAGPQCGRCLNFRGVLCSRRLVDSAAIGVRGAYFHIYRNDPGC